MIRKQLDKIITDTENRIPITLSSLSSFGNDIDVHYIEMLINKAYYNVYDNPKDDIMSYNNKIQLNAMFSNKDDVNLHNHKMLLERLGEVIQSYLEDPILPKYEDDTVKYIISYIARRAIEYIYNHKILSNEDIGKIGMDDIYVVTSSYIEKERRINIAKIKDNMYNCISDFQEGYQVKCRYAYDYTSNPPHVNYIGFNPREVRKLINIITYSICMYDLAVEYKKYAPCIIIHNKANRSFIVYDNYKVDVSSYYKKKSLIIIKDTVLVNDLELFKRMCAMYTFFDRKSEYNRHNLLKISHIDSVESLIAEINYYLNTSLKLIAMK